MRRNLIKMGIFTVLFVAHQLVAGSASSSSTPPFSEVASNFKVEISRDLGPQEIYQLQRAALTEMSFAEKAKNSQRVEELKSQVNYLDRALLDKITANEKVKKVQIEQMSGAQLKSHILGQSSTLKASGESLVALKAELQQVLDSGDQMAIGQARAQLNRLQREHEGHLSLYQYSQDVGVEKGLLENGEKMGDVTILAKSERAKKTADAHQAIECQENQEKKCSSGKSFNCIVRACMSESDHHLYNQTYKSCDGQGSELKKQECREDLLAIGQELADIDPQDRSRGGKGGGKASENAHRVEALGGLAFGLMSAYYGLTQGDWLLCLSGPVEMAAAVFSYTGIEEGKKSGLAMADMFSKQVDEAMAKASEDGVSFAGQLIIFTNLQQFWKAQLDHVRTMEKKHKKAAEMHLAGETAALAEIAALSGSILGNAAILQMECAGTTAAIAGSMYLLSNNARENYTSQKHYAENAYNKVSAMLAKLQKVGNSTNFSVGEGMDSDLGSGIDSEVVQVTDPPKTAGPDKGGGPIVDAESDLPEISEDQCPRSFGEMGSCPCTGNGCIAVDVKRVFNSLGPAGMDLVQRGLGPLVSDIQAYTAGTTSPVSASTLSQAASNLDGARDKIIEAISIKNKNLSEQLKDPKRMAESIIHSRLSPQELARTQLEAISSNQAEMIPGHLGLATSQLTGAAPSAGSYTLAATASDPQSSGSTYDDVGEAPLKNFEFNLNGLPRSIAKMDIANANPKDIYDYNETKRDIVNRPDFDIFEVISHRYTVLRTKKYFIREK